MERSSSCAINLYQVKHYRPVVRQSSQCVTHPGMSLGPSLPSPGPQRASQSSTGHIQRHLVMQPPAPASISNWWPWHSEEQFLPIQPHWHMSHPWISLAPSTKPFPSLLHWVWHVIIENEAHEQPQFGHPYWSRLPVFMIWFLAAHSFSHCCWLSIE